MRTTSNRKLPVKELRARLLAERGAILSERQSQFQVLSTVEKAALDDQVPVLHEQFVAISNTGRSREKLASIDSALDRLARGEFGVCEECEEDIPLKRLQATPWALYCIACQERRESLRSSEEAPLAAIA